MIVGIAQKAGVLIAESLSFEDATADV